MSDVFKASNLSVGHRGKKVLKDVEWSIKKGEMIALMGVNGCGKTTLLKTISGLLPPVCGKIEYSGQDVYCLSEKERAKVISVVLTDRPVLTHLSVFEILMFSRFSYKERESVSKEIIKRSVKLFGIEHLLFKEYSTLSDGQKQIVLICRAVAQTTDIIILDEPFTFLDIPRKLEVIGLFKKIVKENKTGLIFSTHDFELVYSLNIKVLLIDDTGSLVCDDARSLSKNGILERVFGHPEFSLNENSGQFVYKDDISQN